MTLVLDREAIESFAERQVDGKDDPQVVAFQAVVSANEQVRQLEADLYSMQNGHSLELCRLWDTLVPQCAEYSELHVQIERELEIAENHVDLNEALTEIKSRYAEALSLAWSRHASRYHEPAREHMRVQYVEQQVVEDELRKRLNDARNHEKKVRQVLDGFLLGVA